MLRTDCKLDQFVNGPPVYKPVIPDCFFPVAFIGHTKRPTVDHAHEVVSCPAHAQARFLTV